LVTRHVSPLLFSVNNKCFFLRYFNGQSIPKYCCRHDCVPSCLANLSPCNSTQVQSLATSRWSTHPRLVQKPSPGNIRVRPPFRTECVLLFHTTSPSISPQVNEFYTQKYGRSIRVQGVGPVHPHLYSFHGLLTPHATVGCAPADPRPRFSGSRFEEFVYIRKTMAVSSLDYKLDWVWNARGGRPCPQKTTKGGHACFLHTKSAWTGPTCI